MMYVRGRWVRIGEAFHQACVTKPKNLYIEPDIRFTRLKGERQLQQCISYSRTCTLVPLLHIISIHSSLTYCHHKYQRALILKGYNFFWACCCYFKHVDTKLSLATSFTPFFYPHPPTRCQSLHLTSLSLATATPKPTASPPHPIPTSCVRPTPNNRIPSPSLSSSIHHIFHTHPSCHLSPGPLPLTPGGGS